MDEDQSGGARKICLDPESLIEAAHVGDTESSIRQNIANDLVVVVLQGINKEDEEKAKGKPASSKAYMIKFLVTDQCKSVCIPSQLLKNDVQSEHKESEVQIGIKS